MTGFDNLAKRTGLFHRSVIQPFPLNESAKSRDKAQVCLNGHLINWSFNQSPEYNQEYCELCGVETITACPDCSEAIPGKVLKREVVKLTKKRPQYCIHCGKLYPWTDRMIRAAKDLIKELHGLSEDDKIKLSDGIEDLVRETPRANVVIVQFKKLAKDIGKDGWSALKRVLFELVSKEIKDQFGMT